MKLPSPWNPAGFQQHYLCCQTEYKYPEKICQPLKYKEITMLPSELIHVEDHGEIEMAKAQVYKAAKNALEIHKLLKHVDNLEAWMQAKITMAAENLEAVASNLEYDVVSAAAEVKMDL